MKEGLFEILERGSVGGRGWSGINISGELFGTRLFFYSRGKSFPGLAPVGNVNHIGKRRISRKMSRDGS